MNREEKLDNNTLLNGFNDSFLFANKSLLNLTFINFFTNYKLSYYGYSNIDGEILSQCTNKDEVSFFKNHIKDDFSFLLVSGLLLTKNKLYYESLKDKIVMKEDLVQLTNDQQIILSVSIVESFLIDCFKVILRYNQDILYKYSLEIFNFQINNIENKYDFILSKFDNFNCYDKLRIIKDYFMIDFDKYYDEYNAYFTFDNSKIKNIKEGSITAQLLEIFTNNNYDLDNESIIKKEDKYWLITNNNKNKYRIRKIRDKYYVNNFENDYKNFFNLKKKRNQIVHDTLKYSINFQESKFIPEEINEYFDIYVDSKLFLDTLYYSIYKKYFSNFDKYLLHK